MKLLEGIHYERRQTVPAPNESCRQMHPPQKGPYTCRLFEAVKLGSDWLHGVGYCRLCGEVTESAAHRNARILVNQERRRGQRPPLSEYRAEILRGWPVHAGDGGYIPTSNLPGSHRAWGRLASLGYLMHRRGQWWCTVTLTDAAHAALAQYAEWEAVQKKKALDNPAQA